MNGKDSMAETALHLLHPDMVANTTHTEDLGLGRGAGARTIGTEVNSTKDHMLCSGTLLAG